MDVIEYTPTRDQYAYTFGGVAAAMRVRPGTALRVWSEDAFNGALRSVDDLSSAKVDLRFVNPQTGPFYVGGAEPGDTLVLHLVALEPARDWGASRIRGTAQRLPDRAPARADARHRWRRPGPASSTER
jgi:acetamidase/formamidase